MLSISKKSASSFPNVICNKLVIYPVTTTLKWDNEQKNKKINIVGDSDVAKVVSGGVCGILADKGFMVGLESKTWYYEINLSTTIHVGMASKDQDFTTTTGVAVDQIVNVIEGDKILFTLTPASTLLVRHEKGNGIINGTKVYDMNAFIGQAMYPWVSTNSSSGSMMVKIMENFKFETYVDQYGVVHMTGSKNAIVDFNLDGDGGTYIRNGDSSVTVENSGDININGGVRFKCENIAIPIESVELKDHHFTVVISSPSTKKVVLPEASNNSGKYYSIIRNYPVQIGETWQDSALRIVVTGSDKIEDVSSLGIPPESNVQVMSDGISKWRIM